MHTGAYTKKVTAVVWCEYYIYWMAYLEGVCIGVQLNN